MVIWLLGLSGAGKTTVAQCLYKRVKPDCSNLVFLDGDNLRDVWGDTLGHTIEARRMNAHRISHLARMLDRQNIHVIAAVMSIFPDWLAWNRENFSQYFEVFLDAPMELVLSRDSKGLYKAATNGEMENVVGVDIPYSRPVAPDCTISPDLLSSTPDQLADYILDSMPAPMKDQLCPRS
jgi:cytidine diphosphoramidate kinase